MTQNRSFKDYIAKRFDNQFGEIAECDIKKRFDETIDRAVRELNEALRK